MMMHPNAISLELLDDQIAAVTEARGYASEREVIRDALEALLNAHPALRLEMALMLWKQNKITLSRAVEIAQSDHETFKAEMAKRNLYIEIDATADEIEQETQNIPRLQPKV
jgi:predicted HTH domain antitoxin